MLQYTIILWFLPCTLQPPASGGEGTAEESGAPWLEYGVGGYILLSYPENIVKRTPKCNYLGPYITLGLSELSVSMVSPNKALLRLWGLLGFRVSGWRACLGQFRDLAKTSAKTWFSTDTHSWAGLSQRPVELEAKTSPYLPPQGPDPHNC